MDDASLSEPREFQQDQNNVKGLGQRHTWPRRVLVRTWTTLHFRIVCLRLSAFITSKLNYCISLPSTLLQKLQYIQNSASRRRLTHTRFGEHVSPILKLHRLPVQYHIRYKVLIITYKSLRNLASSPHPDLLHQRCPARRLRSAHSNLLTPLRTKHLLTPSIRTKHLLTPFIRPKNLLNPFIKTKHRTSGELAFAAAAPSLWNSLPQSSN
ncbi:hypothetical protein NL108_009622 [Boleophthalmus pectinirostris]|uniref:uncharacterized protein LOC129409780 isoform X1 n=1 Tax=Boleophthalmus pectinirostris TaxID=150288 RepID=UPI00242BB369|nr:uncharacterized protein LOC129409780 isoform X1 [Boleophthalmus pectinirostris]KAJ0055670.1 hypothetical protein NL108_009622 [Boleophthalmus pectinirostris]